MVKEFMSPKKPKKNESLMVKIERLTPQFLDIHPEPAYMTHKFG